MKNKIALLLMFFPLAALAGLNPVLQSHWTTNAANSLPLPNEIVAEITVFPNSNYLYNGVTFTPTNSVTCGIQEALNSIPTAANANSPAGATIRFAPGIFYTYTNISVATGSKPFSLSFEGPGLSAGGITYVGSITQDVLTVGIPGTESSFVFNAKNMWFASNVNGLTNIVHLNGHDIGFAGGGVAKANIDSCWFGLWIGMTNTANAIGFSPSVAGEPMGLAHNLIPLNVDCNLNENVIVQNCQFTYVNGMSYTSAHGQILNNVFEFSGIITQVCPTNNWPKTSPYCVGADIYMVNSQSPADSEDNNFQPILIMGNTFVGGKTCYFVSSTGSGSPQPFISYMDSFEVVGFSPVSFVVTAGNRWTGLEPNPTEPYGNAGWWSLGSYGITNTSDYTLAYNNALPGTWGTNPVVFVDDIDYTNTAPQYNFSGNLNAASYLSASNAWLSALFTATNGLGIGSIANFVNSNGTAEFKVRNSNNVFIITPQ